MLSQNSTQCCTTHHAWEQLNLCWVTIFYSSLYFWNVIHLIFKGAIFNPYIGTNIHYSTHWQICIKASLHHANVAILYQESIRKAILVFIRHSLISDISRLIINLFLECHDKRSCSASIH